LNLLLGRLTLSPTRSRKWHAVKPHPTSSAGHVWDGNPLPYRACVRNSPLRSCPERSFSAHHLDAPRRVRRVLARNTADVPPSQLLRGCIAGDRSPAQHVSFGTRRRNARSASTGKRTVGDHAGFDLFRRLSGARLTKFKVFLYKGGRASHDVPSTISAGSIHSLEAVAMARESGNGCNDASDNGFH